jgi:antitoxin (DNA-binding transcriptional repressor) of toxin-antitoxin stability system
MRKYKTNIIGFKELRENAEVYIREIEKGRSFLVIRRSKPIFKITPVDEWGMRELGKK